MRKFLITLLFLSFTSVIFSVDYTSVSLDHPVYDLLESGELKGLLTDLSDVKPYTYKVVRDSLLTMKSYDTYLSNHELVVLESFIAEFKKENLLPIGLFLSLETETKGNINSLDFHTFNVGYMGIKNDFLDVISYNINIGVTLDIINPDAFEPYTFTKRYDGFHITFGEDKYHSGEKADGFAFSSLPELGVSLFDDSLYLGLNRVRRNWGEGISSLLLAESGRPIFGFDYKWKMNKYITLSGLVGSLGNANGTGDNDSQNKNITSHYLEIKPCKYLDLVLFDTAIWGKRAEVGYLFLLPTFITQQIVGDVDNIAMGGTITGRYPGIGKVYFSLFIDEMENDEWANFFHHNKNMYAWNAGIKTIIPKIPFGTFSFQYTKIEPYCYAHYEQRYPNYGDTLIDINFTNDNENIAYNLPPNSDQFLFNISAKPAPGLTTILNYSFVRHGDNPGDTSKVQGDIDAPLDFAEHHAGNIEEKDFLNDGIYEYIHTVSAEAYYNFYSLPIFLEVKLGYSFVIADNYNNVAGNRMVMNVLTLGVKAEL